MKLDRNIHADGRGKYALILLRKLRSGNTYSGEVEQAIQTLAKAGLIDWGIVGTESEFFVIRLKDRYAAPSLFAYANAAAADDPQWASEVREMALRAELSPWQKQPD